ncbi:hypothetical protein B9T07_09340 [Limnospira fusiformis CCALA 023]|uniref:hypothetical protein n=1 Tax=Limnospira platensis TaxID=118562 RepID=UPI00396DDB1F
MINTLNEVNINLLKKVEKLTGMSQFEAEVAIDRITKSTPSGFMKIKNLEREGKTTPDIQLVNNFVNRMPPYQGTIYRGIPFSKLEKLQSFLTLIQRNGGYTIDSMTSFTSDELVAEDYAYSAYPVIIRIKNNISGISIQEFLIYSENEIIIPKGTKYRVTHLPKVIEPEEILYIDMEEI